MSMPQEDFGGGGDAVTCLFNVAQLCVFVCVCVWGGGGGGGVECSG